MNINCLICTDLFTPVSDIYATPCGHIFHYHCVLHWFENSKTCPHCRTKVTVKALVRLYVNVANSGTTEDATILQHKLDGLEFQLRLKEKDIKTFTDKYKCLEEQNKALRVKVKELEMTELKHESVMAALKDQIKFFKEKSKSCDKLLEEVGRLKSEIKKLENVQAALNGSRQQVEDIIRNENNIESLALLAAVLKKSLVDAERRKRELQLKLKKTVTDLSVQKTLTQKLNCDYEDTKRQLESLKTNYQKEITYLKNKFAQLQSKAVLNDSVNNSIKRITLESPVNFNRTPVAPANKSKFVDLTDSPDPSQSVPDTPKSQTSKDKAIEIESPLLPSSLAIAIPRQKMVSSNTDQNKFSIFKNKSSQFEPLNFPTTSNKKSEVNYDGLGGSSKEDIFPSPQKNLSGVKRPKTSKIGSCKFKKLSADAGKTNRKLSDFLS